MSQKNLKPGVMPKKLLLGMNNKRDKRGIVVTWVVASHDNGEPWLGMVDAKKVKLALENKLCQTCGLSLDSTKVFVGPSQGGMFFEPSMHLECAIYSLKACPHLSKELSHNKLDIKTSKDYDLFAEKIDGVMKEIAVPTDTVVSYECSQAIHLLKKLYLAVDVPTCQADPIQSSIEIT